jgi:hypothetical protein
MALDLPEVTGFMTDRNHASGEYGFCDHASGVCGLIELNTPIRVVENNATQNYVVNTIQ